jgi:hypothetical protein
MSGIGRGKRMTVTRTYKEMDGGARGDEEGKKRAGEREILSGAGSWAGPVVKLTSSVKPRGAVLADPD